MDLLDLVRSLTRRASLGSREIGKDGLFRGYDEFSSVYSGATI